MEMDRDSPTRLANIKFNINQIYEIGQGLTERWLTIKGT